MTETPRLPNGAQPDPDHEGWYSWGDFPRGSFAAATGRLIFRPTGEGTAEVRMFPTEAHQNMGGSIHGGAVMSFTDMALFAGGRCAGMAEGHYVTLDMHTRFLARGAIGKPLTAHVRLVRQTAGGIVFLSGFLEQDGAPCYDFTGTLKKISPRAKSADGDSSDDAQRR
ncbi:PaaI family thioesterase [Sphingomonas rhizophila]|uniref:PaaI family thioesterase n=1 Tax=Sphingomonas rhizophila TaxID=2071607 RepID=A0A7G9S999_9SPHN|nr:PaaI family thioesterase [Sphingomonas rhizophila]QNN64424.1 PaaI family thioesterase [Sphingomonas rhizophila]